MTCAFAKEGVGREVRDKVTKRGTAKDGVE